ncbi:hypothetical protein BH09ACT11_BH09ACT11_07540 [soil metagenome]
MNRDCRFPTEHTGSTCACPPRQLTQSPAAATPVAAMAAASDLDIDRADPSGDCPICGSHDDDLAANTGICESCRAGIGRQWDSC